MSAQLQKWIGQTQHEAPSITFLFDSPPAALKFDISDHTSVEKMSGDEEQRWIFQWFVL